MNVIFLVKQFGCVIWQIIGISIWRHPVSGRRFYILQDILTVLETQPASYSQLVTGLFLGRDMKLTFFSLQCHHMSLWTSWFSLLGTAGV